MKKLSSIFTRLCEVGVLSFALAITLVSAQTPNESSPEVRQKTFELVWNTINENFYDPEFGGVDWGKMRGKYGPQVANVNTDRELHELLNKMLSELHVSHLAVFKPENATFAFPEPEALTGIVLKDIDNQVVIRRILKGSSAAKAGLRAGFIIKKVDNEIVGNSLEGGVRLAGGHGKCRVSYLDEHDKPKETVLNRRPLQPDNIAKKEFTENTVWHAFIESKRLSGGVGYIHFTNFYEELNEKLRRAIKSMKDAPGIVLDLRGNGGGADGVALKLAGLLLDKKTLLAISKTHQGERRSYIADPDSAPYLGPVVILVDEDSYSQAEQIAASLQDIGRAVVIGKRTPGKDLDGALQELPTGAVLLYPVGQPRTLKGIVVEGRGVIPDIEVSLTRADLLKGRDSQLEAAIEYIKSVRRRVSTR